MTFLLWLWLLLLLFATPLNPLSISCHCENKFLTRINLSTHIDIISCENYLNYPVVRTDTWFSKNFHEFKSNSNVQTSRAPNLYMVFVQNFMKFLENHVSKCVLQGNPSNFHSKKVCVHTNGVTVHKRSTSRQIKTMPQSMTI